MVQPTLCFSLKTGLRIAAVIDILIALVMVAASTFGLVYSEKYKEEVFQMLRNPPPELHQFLDLHHLGETSLRVFLGFSVFYWLQKIWLGSLMYKAAVEENTGKCRVWIVYTFILLILSVAFFLASICIEVVQPMAIPFYVLTFMVREYSIWILFRFKGKLDDGKSPLLVNASEFTNL